MADFDLSRATTTNLKTAVPDFIVQSKALDVSDKKNDEYYYYFDDATEKQGYLLNIPEVWSAASALATYTVGQGFTTTDMEMKVQLEHVIGTGKESFNSIMWNMLVMKWLIGDSFAEVKRGKNGKYILNIIPIGAERVRLVYGKDGMLKRYDVWNGDTWKPVQKENMLHFINKKIGDSIKGSSQLDPIKFAIDAKNEALADERAIKHRDKALGIAYYKTNNEGKIQYANSQIEKGSKNGEIIGVPEGTVKIEPWSARSSEDRQAWIQYLENFVYQNLGVPRSIVTSDGTSEVGGKMGNVNFEPVHQKERNDIETDLKIQQGIIVAFNKPPSLGGLQNETLTKNSGQTNIQPNDVTADLQRE